MKTTVPPNVPPAAEQTGASTTVVNEAAQNAREIVDKVAGAAHDAARVAAPVIDRAAELAHKVVDSAATGAAPAAKWLDQHTNELNVAQEKLLNDTRKYIAENPLKSVGIAFAVGLLLARMVR
jgi:ElaB/YqjD/DUF883 family membrane-anchored ribosome-binding protein